MFDPDEDEDVLELTDEVEEQDDQPDDQTDPNDETDDEETVVTFGDEELPQAAPAETDLIKHLRNELRQRDKALAEVRRHVPVEQTIEVGEEPSLDTCDYDEDKFRAEYRAWIDRGNRAEKQKAEREKAQAKQSEEWQGELQRYERDKVALALPDADSIEETITGALDPMQQSVLVMAADRPAVVSAALAKHPAKLAELAKISNPVKLAAAIVKLEGALKVTKIRKAPAPDVVERGSAGIAAGLDKQLERLEKEAAKTGDRTKLIDYKRKLKAK